MTRSHRTLNHLPLALALLALLLATPDPGSAQTISHAKKPVDRVSFKTGESVTFTSSSTPLLLKKMTVVLDPQGKTPVLVNFCSEFWAHVPIAAAEGVPAALPGLILEAVLDIGTLDEALIPPSPVIIEVALTDMPSAKCFQWATHFNDPGVHYVSIRWASTIEGAQIRSTNRTFTVMYGSDNP